MHKLCILVQTPPFVFCLVVQDPQGTVSVSVRDTNSRQSLFLDTGDLFCNSLYFGYVATTFILGILSCPTNPEKGLSFWDVD